MRIVRILLFLLLVAFGIFIFIYGGYDDSPGAQLLGLIAVVLGIFGIVKTRKKNTD